MSAPTQSQVDAWKEEYERVYSLSDRGVDYVFRELTCQEYDRIIAYQDANDSASTEEFIVDTGLLWPLGIDVDSIPAGIISGLAEEIFECSGFSSPKRVIEMLNKHRERVAEARGLMKAFILSSMPAYKEEELDALTYDALAAKVALAEKIIEVNQTSVGIENKLTLDLIDPDEEEQRQKNEAVKHAAQKKPGQAGYNDPVAQKLQQALG